VLFFSLDSRGPEATFKTASRLMKNANVNGLGKVMIVMSTFFSKNL
jgi:hypothetical protein